MDDKKRDPVDHYVRGGLECIDAMKAISTPEEFRGYLRLTALKYLWRLGEKDCPAKEAKKARDYVTWLEAELAVAELPVEAVNPSLVPVKVTLNGVDYWVTKSTEDDPLDVWSGLPTERKSDGVWPLHGNPRWFPWRHPESKQVLERYKELYE